MVNKPRHSMGGFVAIVESKAAITSACNRCSPQPATSIWIRNNFGKKPIHGRCSA